MATKKTMTLNLTDEEMKVLERISVKKDMSKTAVLRLALRLFQIIDIRAEKGEKIYFEDESKKEKAELVII